MGLAIEFLNHRDFTLKAVQSYSPLKTPNTLRYTPAHAAPLQLWFSSISSCVGLLMGGSSHRPLQRTGLWI